MSDLRQLATASGLNNGYRITGREGLPEGFIEPVICKLPFRSWHLWLRRTRLARTPCRWLVAAAIHSRLLTIVFLVAPSGLLTALEK
jgi:hypothetical protein